MVVAAYSGLGAVVVVVGATAVLVVATTLRRARERRCDRLCRRIFVSLCTRW